MSNLTTFRLLFEGGLLVATADGKGPWVRSHQAKEEIDRLNDEMTCMSEAFQSCLLVFREEVMNWLPDSAEGDAFKAKLICQIDTALSKAKD
ncbi:hypothetical protein FA04_14700 [Ensifer adhaerens]|uniref:Uncharacterized protein n=1 Tax=Ensifer adhaerens TaxID=106592 RepID=A0ABY8HDL3_ENSAD|nr:hypothetical protein [Ensifer adhaerens]ANK73761.1 hypothetical protein FA04_14700 [Ensifer adhaerens]KDP70278.1 hypothetical protein FA04_29000 [Ensifer adhaerens]WFP89846.1 hypothetical protein P4B07_14930 [Ensifer adhaerens]